MENVLEAYHRPYNADRPLVRMDKQPVQLCAEVRAPLPTRAGAITRVDHEYARCGVANLFMFTEPLVGWREVVVTARRTRLDFAAQLRWLLDERYPRAERVTLVLDNLNTHTPASLYEAFAPSEARRLVERIEWVHTPKHGSWLNIAECELSAMSRQCLGERMGSTAELTERTRAWHGDRNARQRGVSWQFTTSEARVKLKSLYPQIQMG